MLAAKLVGFLYLAMAVMCTEYIVNAQQSSGELRLQVERCYSMLASSSLVLLLGALASAL